MCQLEYCNGVLHARDVLQGNETIMVTFAHDTGIMVIGDTIVKVTNKVLYIIN